jgi:undecaprenyl phosphate-alpha-L-ara4FN deformylase
MILGLRVDVDTFRGTKLGVPALSRMLAELDITATFYFSVGPDNMGRHLWRLRYPSFLWKMLRSNAPGLYGWDILLRGTLWPGPEIGRHLAPVIRDAEKLGHEVGLHAWDHHAWQANIDTWSDDQVRQELQRGTAALERILGHPPASTAAPAWKCDGRTLDLKEDFNFGFNSDCRGESIFIPADGASTRNQPQIPVTLPTYDEEVGREGMTAADYYRRLEELMDPQKLNVLAIHAEVEGISQLDEFRQFLERIRAAGWSCTGLGDLVRRSGTPAPGRMGKATFPGREGWLAHQFTGKPA